MSRSVSIYYNLAMVICNLFNDGQFRTAHIAFDWSVFDVEIIVEIESVCSKPVPWFITDIHKPFTLPWNTSSRTDNILQLIFFDSKQLTNEIVQLQEYFTFYRIFVFPATDEIETIERFSTIKQFNRGYSSSALIMYFGTNNDCSVSFSWMPINDYDYDNAEWRPMCMNTELRSDRFNWFDETFGKYQRPIAVNYESFSGNVDGDPLQSYYIARLNRSYSRTYYINANPPFFKLFTAKPTTDIFKEFYYVFEYDKKIE